MIEDAFVYIIITHVYYTYILYRFVGRAFIYTYRLMGHEIEL